MMPPKIHHVWLGPNKKSELIERCVESQKRIHPSWEFCDWNDASLMGKIDPALYEHGTYAGSSNIVRLWALHEYGGVFLDADIEVIRPFGELLCHHAFFARQPDGVPCNAVLGAEPQSRWIKEMLDKCLEGQRYVDASFACHMMERTNMEDVTELPTDTFYPYNWDEKPKPPTERTLAIHHWDKSWLKH